MKRLFDFCVALIGIVLSSPMWLLIALLIYREDHGPVFFFQKRCGKQGQTMRLVKFRTMEHRKYATNKLMDIENDPRVTRIGRILRGTAMDELPTLINILKGDMSFVGPKPLPFEIGSKERLSYADITKVPGYYIRSSVKPGLTGIAQIYASKNVSRRAKFHYDNLYVKNRGLWFDIRLILLSFWVTFKGRWETRDRKL